MNCKPGDLAIVVLCRKAPQNIGAIRTVVQAAHGGWLPAWELDRELPSGDDCICDTCVRPIKPLSDDERREAADSLPCDFGAPRRQVEHMR